MVVLIVDVLTVECGVWSVNEENREKKSILCIEPSQSRTCATVQSQFLSELKEFQLHQSHKYHVVQLTHYNTEQIVFNQV